MIPPLSSISFTYEVIKASCCTREFRCLKILTPQWIKFQILLSWKKGSPSSRFAASASLLTWILSVCESLQVWTSVEILQRILSYIWNQWMDLDYADRTFGKEFRGLISLRTFYRSIITSTKVIGWDIDQEKQKIYTLAPDIEWLI